MRDGAITETARKVWQLLQHLDVNAKTFSEQTGISQAHISKTLSGERGTDVNRAARIRHAAAATYGVPDVYWETGDVRHLAGVQRSSSSGTVSRRPEVVGLDMAHLHDELRYGLAKLAADRDEPAEMIKALLTSKAPEGAELVWWTRRYLELRDHYAGSGKAG